MILNNASICAAQPLWYEPIYKVTKAALSMLSKNLANAFVSPNIRVNGMNLGLVLTPDLIKTATELAADSGDSWESYIDGVPGSTRRSSASHPRGGRQLLRVPMLRPSELQRRRATYYVDGGMLKVVG